MNINEFFDPADDAAPVKFNNPGDSVAGLILREPELAPDKFNPDEKVVIVTLDTESGFQRVFCRKPQLRAVGRAAKDAGVADITVGGWLSLTYSGDRELDNGRTARDWVAEYKPPRGTEQIGLGELGETAVSADADPWAEAVR